MDDCNFSLTDLADPFVTELHPFSREHVFNPSEKEPSKSEKAVFDGHYLKAALLYSEEIGGKDSDGKLFYNRAKCLMELNYLHLALKDIEKAIDLDPNEITYRYRLLDCYLRMADTDKAEEILSVIGKNFTSYSRAATFKTSQINKLKDFKSRDFESSIEANETFLRFINSKIREFVPACPDFKFLKMRTLVILTMNDEIDGSLNDSNMLDALIAYYHGDIRKSTQLIMSTPDNGKKVQAVEKFKMQVKAFEDIESADTMAKNNNFGASLELLEKLCAVDPSNTEINQAILLRMAKLNCQLKKPDDALNLVSKVLEINSKCFVAASIQAECLLQKNQLVQAASKCDEILANALPDHIKENVFRTRERALECIENLKTSRLNTKTKENLADSNEKDSENQTIKYYIQQASSFIERKDFERALEEAEKAVKVGLYFCIAIPEAILCFLTLGMIEEVTILNQALQDEKIAAALATINDCNTMMNSFGQNRADDLLKVVEKAQTIAPASIVYRNLKIKYLIMLGRYIEAEKAISEVLKMYPQHGKMTFYQCLNYYHQGEMSHLSEKLKENILLPTDDLEASEFLWNAKKILENFEKGSSMFQRESFTRAQLAFLDIAKTYQHQNKYRQLVMYNLGSCCVKLKKYEEAIPFFDESLFIDEAHVKSLIKRAKCHYLCKLYEDCIIDCNELNRIGASGEIKGLQDRARSDKTKRGDLNINNLLTVRENCKPTEKVAAFEKFLEMYDPVKSKHPNKLKGYQQIWRYDYVKTKFDQFKSSQNPWNNVSP